MVTEQDQGTHYLLNDQAQLIGTYVFRQGMGGWTFIPQTVARTPSRKGHLTIADATPRWAKTAAWKVFTRDEYELFRAEGKDNARVLGLIGDDA